MDIIYSTFLLIQMNILANALETLHQLAVTEAIKNYLCNKLLRQTRSTLQQLRTGWYLLTVPVGLLSCANSINIYMWSLQQQTFTNSILHSQ